MSGGCTHTARYWYKIKGVTAVPPNDQAAQSRFGLGHLCMCWYESKVEKSVESCPYIGKHNRSYLANFTNASEIRPKQSLLDLHLGNRAWACVRGAICESFDRTLKPVGYLSCE